MKAYSLDDFSEALKTLKEGGVILYPTDTIWGVGCDATNEAAVRRIYQIKQRDDSKALILLLDSLTALQQYIPDSFVQAVHTSFVQVDSASFVSRPTTIIYPSAHNLPSSLLADDGSVGIRLTCEPFTRDLCAALGHPLVSTSANISGHPSPTCFADIESSLLNDVDYVCRYRQSDLTPAQPSRIVRLNIDGTYTTLRD